MAHSSADDSSMLLQQAPVAKLVDAPDLGSGVLRRVGSSPIRRTVFLLRVFFVKALFFLYKRGIFAMAVQKYESSSEVCCSFFFCAVSGKA